MVVYGICVHHPSPTICSRLPTLLVNVCVCCGLSCDRCVFPRVSEGRCVHRHLSFFAPASASNSAMVREGQVRQRVSTSVTSAVLLNTGHLGTFSGLLKVFQLVLGFLAVGISGHQIQWNYKSTYDVMLPELFFLVVTTTCLVTTALLLLSFMLSIATATMLPKTLFMSLLQGVLAYLMTCCSINLLRELVSRNQDYDVHEKGYGSKVFAGVIGIFNTMLYIVYTVYSVLLYRRG